jgi:hypothetical protein
MAPSRQANFSGGEIADELHGRTDLPVYATGEVTLRNFIATPDGQLLNRPGTTYVAEVKTPDKQTRLIPFVADRSYVLEFGDEYFRVYFEGDYLEVDIATTYDEADLFRLAYAQSGDILTIVHPDYPPREVVRTGHTTWEIRDKSFAAVATAPSGGSRTLDATTTPKKPWEVWVTGVDENGNESIVLKVVSQPTHGTYCAEAGTSNLYGWTAASGAVLYRVFRGQSGVPGYIGASLTTSFRDDGQKPDYEDRPPTFPNPFGSSGNYPAAVTYHDQRLWFGGTDNKPNGLWGSVVGLFNLFEGHQPPVEDDAVIVGVASRRYEEIRGLASSSRALMALTNATEYAAAGAGDGEPITATGITVPPHSKAGSAWLQPLEADHVLLHVQERGSRVRDLLYDANLGGYVGSDLTAYAHHLVDGHTIVDWAYTRNPWGIVWAVRDDGILLGMTYQREQNVVAWHRHDTPSGDEVGDYLGRFESVCSVPEGSEDALYMVVKRLINSSWTRYIERLSTRQVSDARLGVFFDCAITFDERNTDTAKTATLSGGITWTVGDTIAIDTTDPTFVEETDTNGSTYFVVNPDGLLVGTHNNRSVVRILIDQFLSTTSVSGTIEYGTVPTSMRGEDKPFSTYGLARINRTVPHLKQEIVGAISDGFVDGGTVEGPDDALELTIPGCVQHVGLQYTSQLEQLSAPASAAQGLAKLVARLVSELKWPASAATVKVGGTGALDDSSLLTPIREAPDPSWPGAVPLVSETFVTVVSGQWEKGARGCVQAESGLPVAIIGLARELEYGQLP